MNIYRRTERGSKRPVNLTADADLVAEAKSFDFNMSRIFEDALQKAVLEERQRRWYQENRDSIDAYNARVERQGTLGEQLWRR